MWQHIICLNCDQNSCIVIACDNTYIMESKDELVFANNKLHVTLDECKCKFLA
jgi:hypothetical protein